MAPSASLLVMIQSASARTSAVMAPRADGAADNSVARSAVATTGLMNERMVRAERRRRSPMLESRTMLTLYPFFLKQTSRKNRKRASGALGRLRVVRQLFLGGFAVGDVAGI